MPELSIVVVTNDSGDYLKECLGSIFIQGFNDYEVIVIHNGVRNSYLSDLSARRQNMVIIENNADLGASKARNQGIKTARAEFTLFLDSDTRLEGEFLSGILADIKSDTSLAAVQPLVLRPDRRTVDSAGIHLSWLRRFYDIGAGGAKETIYNSKRYVFGACTAVAMYRKEALESVRQGDEYFDEDFFYLAEDVDLSWRLRKKGWRTLYSPGLVCLHAGGRSRHRDSVSQYLCFRNRCLMIIKNESLAGFLRYPVVALLYDLWRNIFMLFTNTGLFFKGIVEIIKLYPRMREKRRKHFSCPGSAQKG
jgi:GT2 family glycosyltransferase